MNSYIDCHSHILYGIDDGAKTIDASIKIIKNMINLGFKSIVLTPHYRGNYLTNNKEKKLRLFNLNEELKNQNIDIKLYLANEVKITSNILDLIKEDEISLLGNYLFLELPFDTKIYNLDKIIYELQSNNINIILVHPERYSYFKKEDFEKLIASDVLFQVNYESIIGKYGLDSKNKVKYLYKNNMVSFVASDVHSSSTIMFSKFDIIKKKIIKLVGEETFNDITYNNINKIISELKK
ncbi:MAG: hypothetical protein IJ572_05280 [Bacilli bacterium]|nr:hypothetical protein [Bacilli bacterium]